MITLPILVTVKVYLFKSLQILESISKPELNTLNTCVIIEILRFNIQYGLY